MSLVTIEFSSIKVLNGDKLNDSDSAECVIPACGPQSPEREGAAPVKQLVVRTHRWTSAYSIQVHTLDALLDSKGCCLNHIQA